jgi:hypothetical protein
LVYNASEQIREQKRNVDKSIRLLEREMKKLEAEDKKSRTEIKTLALNGNNVN